MARDSAIEWTDHTFNPWWGCTRVSPACKFCYAEAWSKRLGKQLWGKGAERRFFGEKHWRDPIKWNREAEHDGERRRVFCASMADVFEDRDDLNPWRARLWPLIENTPWLDWQLLTKRPEHIGRFVPWHQDWPGNVWIGTTAEKQKWANKRIPELLQYPAAVRFVSCEPLLGPVNLTQWLAPLESRRARGRLNWVITGGESGARARPMNPAWAEALRDQCKEAGVPFHFKQWGQWGPKNSSSPGTAQVIQMFDGSGRPIQLAKLGKKAAGRVLRGKTWDGFPTPIAA